MIRTGKPSHMQSNNISCVIIFRRMLSVRSKSDRRKTIIKIYSSESLKQRETLARGKCVREPIAEKAKTTVVWKRKSCSSAYEESYL